MSELQEEAAELEEILAKRQKRGKQVDDKPLEEKTVLHSKCTLNIYIYIYMTYVLSGKKKQPMMGKNFPEMQIY